MSLIDEQIAIENNAHHEAKARFDKERLKADAEFMQDPIANGLLSSIVPRYALMLEAWWDDETVGNRGKKVRRDFKELSLDSVGISIAALRTLFTTLFQTGKRLTPNARLAERMYNAVHIENSFQAFKDLGKTTGMTESERVGWRMLSEELRQSAKDKRLDTRLKLLSYTRENFTELQDIEPVDKVKKGLALLKVALQMKVTLDKKVGPINLLQINLLRRKGKSVNITKFTPCVLKHLGEKSARMSSMLLTYYPMVVPPTPWEGMFGGGYVTPRGRGNLPLIKLFRVNDIRDSDLTPEILKAVNTIQSTPWRINKKVFAVMNFCASKGLEVGGLPVNTRDFKLGERRTKEEWDSLTGEEKQTIINDRKALHREADAQVSKALSFKMKLSMARRFIKYEKIYFPHTYDFRGRIYPVPTAVNPQSDKYGQSLLMFAEGKTLGTTGEKWLAIHGANSWGLDGVSFDERLKWIEENTQAICESAEDPLGKREWWSQADDPFGFLAFCCEWGEMNKLGDHTQYVSYLPVKLDATSSGLQHYSAILRDEVGAVATNLSDGDRSDIYKLVANRTKECILSDLETEEDPEESVWKRSFLKVLNRNICKGATMCLPYGISIFGATDDLLEKYREGKLKGAYLEGPPKELTRRVRYLAERIMEGVGCVVKSAIVGMEWLKKVEKLARPEKNKPLGYVTKLGFPYKQQYYKSSTRRVIMFLSTTSVRSTVNKYTREIDRRKSNAAIAPNFIHSQDATHLLKCALEGGEIGINSFSFIHDSFGVHAGHTEVFRNVIREAFVWLYSGDTLKDVQRAWEGQSGVELPDPPYESYGSFDINECLKSSYMFN